MRQLAFDHGPAARERRTPTWGLLLTVGLHVVLAVNWRVAHPPAQDTREERVFDLIPILPPSPPARPAHIQPPAKATTRNTAASRVIPAPEPITMPAEPEPTLADPVVERADPAPAAAMLGRALKDAVAIYRETRKGKSAVPAESGTAWGRFAGGLADAHKDSARTITADSYTTPDGQTIYRIRRNGQYFCRTSGFVRPRIGGAEGGSAEMFDSRGFEGGAGQVRCPSQAEWKKG